MRRRGIEIGLVLIAHSIDESKFQTTKSTNMHMWCFQQISSEALFSNREKIIFIKLFASE